MSTLTECHPTAPSRAEGKIAVAAAFAIRILVLVLGIFVVAPLHVCVQHPYLALLHHERSVDPRVVLVEVRRAVFPDDGYHDPLTAGMKAQVRRYVVHLALKHRPPVLLRLVQGNLLDADFALARRTLEASEVWVSLRKPHPIHLAVPRPQLHLLRDVAPRTFRRPRAPSRPRRGWGAVLVQPLHTPAVRGLERRLGKQPPKHPSSATASFITSHIGSEFQAGVGDDLVRHTTRAAGKNGRRGHVDLGADVMAGRPRRPSRGELCLGNEISPRLCRVRQCDKELLAVSSAEEMTG
mmetsp:Transcript_10592/g.16958  ORF Transcript_10592/g.16958 Transcript_10592/m.16958 type:complete len:295 (-) Transcript_10592:168-1052(-)